MSKKIEFSLTFAPASLMKKKLCFSKFVSLIGVVAKWIGHTVFSVVVAGSTPNDSG